MGIPGWVERGVYTGGYTRVGRERVYTMRRLIPVLWENGRYEARLIPVLWEK